MSSIHCCAADGEVDLMGLVRLLRQDRVAQVQNAEQYSLVHQACLDFADRCGKNVMQYDPSPAPPPPPSRGPPPIPVCAIVLSVLRFSEMLIVQSRGGDTLPAPTVHIPGTSPTPANSV